MISWQLRSVMPHDFMKWLVRIVFEQEIVMLVRFAYILQLHSKPTCRLKRVLMVNGEQTARMIAIVWTKTNHAIVSMANVHRGAIWLTEASAAIWVRLLSNVLESNAGELYHTHSFDILTIWKGHGRVSKSKRKLLDAFSYTCPKISIDLLVWNTIVHLRKFGTKGRNFLSIFAFMFFIDYLGLSVIFPLSFFNS